MDRFSMFILGVITAVVTSLSPALSMEPSEDLVFTVQDKNGRSFIVRPTQQKDTESIIDLEKAHDVLTSKDAHFLTLNASKSYSPFSLYLRQYTQERTGNVIEKKWVAIDPQKNIIVGVFDYENNEGVSLIHPEYRGHGLGIASSLVIHRYLKTKCGQQDLIFNPKEELHILAENSDAPSFLLTLKDYDDFKLRVLPLLDIMEEHYTGFVGDVTSSNIGSLRMCLATGLTVQGVVDEMIRFIFPPSPETEDRSLRTLVERLVSKDTSERLTAQEEFRILYCSTPTEQGLPSVSDAAGSAEAPS